MGVGYRVSSTLGRSIPPSFVVLLLKSGGPPAVARLIIAVVVVALNSQFWRRSATHVCNEILKVFPSLANLNSARAVIFVAFGIRISASGEHCRPNGVFRDSFGDARESVLGVPFARLPIARQAPTTFGIPSDEAFSQYDDFSATLAKTFPFRSLAVRTAAIFLNEPKCSQFSEFHPSQISIGSLLPRTFVAAKFGLSKGTAEHALAI